MSRMSELSAAVAEIRRCGEALISLSGTLCDLFSGGANAEKDPEAPQLDPVVTLEQVRTVLAEKSASGRRAEVQALILECGADRLSAVNPEKYAWLLKKAEAL